MNLFNPSETLRVRKEATELKYAKLSRCLTSSIAKHKPGYGKETQSRFERKLINSKTIELQWTNGLVMDSLIGMIVLRAAFIIYVCYSLLYSMDTVIYEGIEFYYWPDSIKVMLWFIPAMAGIVSLQFNGWFSLVVKINRESREYLKLIDETRDDEVIKEGDLSWFTKIAVSVV